MSRMSRDVVQRRPDEIVEACRQLYETHTFHEITLKDISERTSLSRPSIYNYFSTKEEIFLALLKKEYAMWADDLEAILRAPSMDASYFSQVMAAALDRRQMMLRIQCMDLYEIEEHSGMEALVDFKRTYARVLDLLESCLVKFFPQMDAQARERFIYTLLPFIYGLYAYVNPTQQQKAAMDECGIRYRRSSIYEMAKDAICALTEGLAREGA